MRTGKIRAGEKLTILPSQLPAQALSLTDILDKPINTAYPGMNIKIALNCLYPEDLVPGNFLVGRQDTEKYFVTR